MTETISPIVDEDRRGAPTREDLWEVASAGLAALLAVPGHEDHSPAAAPPWASPTAEACAVLVATWLRDRASLADGTAVDRPLVEAFLEAESALLVFSGEAPARVERARRAFEDLALGALAPALHPVGGR